jgi:hypothetical protein
MLHTVYSSFSGEFPGPGDVKDPPNNTSSLCYICAAPPKPNEADLAAETHPSLLID